MAKRHVNTALASFILTLAIAFALIQTNTIGRLAYAIEEAALEAIDEQLPSEQQVDELARINRLVARKALAAVVSIVTVTELPVEHPRLLQPLPTGPVTGQGSGVIVDAEHGLILTNNHVIDEVDSITVHLPDGRQFDAELVGHDPPTDLAVLKIDAERLFELPLGDSAKLQVGDPVMTVGNPFGFQGTVSKGIVSAIDRYTGRRILDYEGFIQTDAVINPGNSGGPLVNMRAEIVGINTAMETRTGTFNGVGFAIPSSRILKLLPALIKGEKVIRGYLGVAMSDVQDFIAQARELGWNNTYGVIVNRVLPGSPAERAGVHRGDILASLDGSKIDDIGYLGETIAFTQPGEQIVLSVWRDRQLIELETTIEAQPEDFSTRYYAPGDQDDTRVPDNETELAGEVPALGIVVRPLDAELSQRYDLEPSTRRAVVITDVRPESLGDIHGLHPGDMIRSINGRRVRSLDNLDRSLKDADLDEGITLLLENSAGRRSVTLYISQ